MEQVLHQLPNGWKYQKLKSLIKMHYGKALKAEDRINGDIPVFGSNGVVGNHNEYLWSEPTVVIGRKGSVGEANLSLTPSWTIDTAYYVEIIDCNVLDLMYFYYFADRFDVSSISQKGVKPGINRNDYLDLNFPLPPLSEQKRIVEKFDALLTRIDSAIEHLKESVKLADAFYASKLHKEFSKLMKESDIFPFKKLVDNLDGRRIPIKAGERKNTHGTYPYYGATGIIDYVDEYIFEGERLLISEDGANLVARKYPIAFIADGKYWVNNHAHVVDALPELTTNLYLKKFFAWVDLSTYITGSAQPKLSQGKLNTIPVPVPSLSEQAEIVTALDKAYQLTETLKQEVDKKLGLLTSLKASILDSAFKGEL